MSRAAFRAGILVAVLGGLLLRLHALDWDAGTHQHPDERFLTMVASAVQVPSAAAWFDTARSSGNPHNAGFGFYVYGTLPVLVFRAVAVLLHRADYDGLVIVQRGVAATADLVTILIVSLLAFRLAPTTRRREAALLGALLWAFLPFAVQQARFGTVDTLGAAVGVAAVATASFTRGRFCLAAAAGTLVGTAAACKPNLVLAAAPVALFLALPPGDERPGLRRLTGLLAVSALGAALTFRLLCPYAFSGPGLLGLAPNRKWLNGFSALAGMLRGEWWFPPGVQWVDRIPLAEFLANLLLWGTGPALGLLVVLSVIGVLAGALLRNEPALLRILPAVLPAVALLLWQGRQFTSSVRHAHPWLPLLVAASAAALFALAPRRGRVLGVGVALLTVAAGLAFASIAFFPHTRVEASRRIAEIFPSGASIAWESWDDPLPVPVRGVDASRYPGEPLPIFDHPDTAEKIRRIVDILDRSDLIVLSSRRGIGTVGRLPDSFPATAEYYRLLWSGALGFDLAARVERPPSLGPLVLDDRLAEEIFSVYDHPQVALFRRNPRWDRAEAEALLLRTLELPSPESSLPPRLARARGTPPDVAPSARFAPGDSLAPPSRKSAAGTAVSVALWAAALELLGVLGLLALGPLAEGSEVAAWLARPLGVALAGLGWSLLGHLVPGFQHAAVPLFWGGLVAAVSLRAGRRALAAIGGTPRWAFLGLFAVFLAIRAGNPEIYWGEKPMDAAVLNAALRAPRLPIPEPWFSGTPLDYYAHGVLPVSLLSRSTGASPGVAYNLGTAMLPALLGSALLGAGSLLAGRLAGGVMALVLVLLTGTLAPLLNRGYRRDPFGFDGFWSASRVVPDAIDEFPLFTALFADLHAHLLSWAPFGALLLLALWRTLYRPLRGTREDRQGALLLGLLLAAVHLTNPWETPLSILLAAVALPARARDGAPGAERRTAALEPFAFALASGLPAALPTLLATRTAEISVSLWEGPHASAAALTELYGVPLAVLAIAWIALGRGRTRAESVALLAGFAGAGLIVFSETIVVSDRMNTLFKFGLQARVLAGLAAGALLPALLGLRRERGRAYATALAVAVALGAISAVSGLTHVAAVLETRRVPGPRPTLDGFAYVSAYDPAGAARMDDMNSRGGIEPVLDPPGTPYSPSLQTVMRTGRPTIVGWPWHLIQRRRSPGEILRREKDVAFILSSPRDPRSARLLRSYGVLPSDVLPVGPP